MDMLTQILILKTKDKKHQKKKKLDCKIIRTNPNKKIMFFMKFVEYKHLLVSLKIKN